MNKSKNEAAPVAVAAKKHEVTPFKVYSGLELANTAPESCPYLVQGLITECGLTMLCAKPKTGKSTFLRQLAVCVVEGRDFLGKPTKTGNVLYLSLEGQIGKVQMALKNLGYTERNGKLFVVHEHMPRNSEFGLQRLEATIQSLPPLRLLIVDPVKKLLRLADSDSDDDASPALELLEKELAKKHGLQLVYTTHAKKKESDDPGDSTLGSTGFRGSTDTNIFLSKKGQQRTISAEQRWGEALEPTLLSWNLEREEMSLGQTVEEVEEARHEAKQRNTVQRIKSEIFDALLGKKLTTQELLERVTGKTSLILSVLQQMVSGGQVTAQQEGKATFYSLAELPAEQRAA